MRAELCKTCVHTKVCFHDKNLVGDTFVRGFFDADDAWEKYKEWAKAGFPCDDYIPSADVVEVVRCKDCKWFEKWYKELPPYDTGFYCTRPNQQSANLLPTDFCSYGVKRNE